MGKMEGPKRTGHTLVGPDTNGTPDARWVDLTRALPKLSINIPKAARPS